MAQKMIAVPAKIPNGKKKFLATECEVALVGCIYLHAGIWICNFLFDVSTFASWHRLCISLMYVQLLCDWRKRRQYLHSGPVFQSFANHSLPLDVAVSTDFYFIHCKWTLRLLGRAHNIVVVLFELCFVCISC